MNRVDLRDIAGGLLVMLVGGAFAVASLRFSFGQGPVIGPGYFPFATGLITMGLGLAIMLPAFFRAGEKARVPLRPVAAVVAAIAAFGAVVGQFGLVPAVFCATAVAALGSAASRPLLVLVLGLGMALGCWLVFIQGLGLPFRAFRLPS